MCIRARTWIVAGLALCAGHDLVAAQEPYPTRQVQLIVPFAPGGAVDAVARVLATPLAAGLGKPMVIDNRGGAGGVIGMEAAARAPADGHTVLLAHSGLTAMPGLYKKLSFDPVKDFDGVITAVSGSYMLAVSATAPFNSVAELIAHAKANPGKLTYASAGVGSTIHLASEFFKRAAGVDILHVPYKGAAQATTDLIGGQIQMMIGPVNNIQPLATAGKIRALAVTSAMRSPLAPDVPTIAESGLPGFEVIGWYGFAVPAGTPAAAVAKLNAETNRVLKSDEVIAQFRKQGYEPVGDTPEQSSARIRADVAQWTKIIREAGIEPQ
jgi:tripartite-type tricarboxylate transporter receptor subunit TctC